MLKLNHLYHLPSSVATSATHIIPVLPLLLTPCLSFVNGRYGKPGLWNRSPPSRCLISSLLPWLFACQVGTWKAASGQSLGSIRTTINSPCCTFLSFPCAPYPALRLVANIRCPEG
ncbi:hypothetical protein N658DRAFT_309197 [Parathielavia hyrcaniae]|uniref:Uncharacterized protein n=1 Tax=Parathielavia hyrcaniae TaxID=113614 RepID=A0AAN6Q4E2_9PEZI|nr:hypothetical protein N658DRAFT_309197 [Parathielavia hyrcaniae]